MSKTDKIYCIGCGAALQSTAPDQPGYLPAKTFQKYLQQDQLNELYCQRCFRLRHYNEVAELPLNDVDFQNLLTAIGHQRALVVYVVDIFNFSGSVIRSLRQYIGHNPVLLVGNKIDLLPSSFNKNKIKNWLQQQAKRLGLHPVAIQLISAKKLSQIDQLLATIEQYRQQQDVYVIGMTNVGKSTLINAILQDRTEFKELVTTSNFPGTTLNEIRIPLAQGGDLVDTPGILDAHQMSSYLTTSDLKYIAPQTEIHPRVFQLQPQQTLFFAGLARLDFLQGPPSTFVAYVENHLYLHRTKLSHADLFYQRHIGQLLTPPHDPKSFVLQEHTLTIKQKSDVLLAGLGWVVVAAGITIKVYLPQGLKPTVRPALIN